MYTPHLCYSCVFYVPEHNIPDCPFLNDRLLISGLLYSSADYNGLYACKCIEAFCVNYADIPVCWDGGA
jgi:hypothetical protein